MSSTPKPDDLKRFRIFKIEEGIEVWTGKDSVSNDLLTFNFSSSNDIWFHVRGSSGSHALLKIADKAIAVKKHHLETAASICAFYSKAKNAGRVSVAYTEIKNVKKYKGASSGSVVIKGERLIKVIPKLPV